jgi:hypothetical protein
MVRSTGSQPRITVKRRGSKWHAADTQNLRDRNASRRDSEAGRGAGWADDRPLDPGRDRQATVLAH